eukprot:TRINITY_DN5621_c0_g2_i2.p1 TRINITY_DN5621_c0_g2~~TRINITY_DN5621_c0_g2_i2.p1  ORF type:complete len:385 (+),score=113.34 TRINITY_DN5621_c0_g2_i2:35-1189(+)
MSDNGGVSWGGVLAGVAGTLLVQKLLQGCCQKSEAEKRYKWRAAKSANERRRIFKEFVQGVQDDITKTLGELDGQAVFEEDAWEKPNGRGQGRTRVIKNGSIFEQGGCNWSEVFGANLPPAILKKHPHLQGKTFYATGVSMVLHPKNPHIPTVHLNYRYFEAGTIESDAIEQDNVWWFGGGMDLTPWVLYEEDAVSFHQHVKDACDKHGDNLYLPLKKYADEYFCNKHRAEGRGIGGHFYDYFDGNPDKTLYQGENAEMKKWCMDNKYMQPSMSWEQIFEFAKSQAAAFLPAYIEIIKRRREVKVTEDERNWQLYRRGRYVEFNLVHDRGTLFGLQVNGRVESILMSLPPVVKWTYMHKAKCEAEEKLVDALATPKDWLNVEKE